jgi:hypothetical protein
MCKKVSGSDMLNLLHPVKKEKGILILYTKIQGRFPWAKLLQGPVKNSYF